MNGPDLSFPYKKNKFPSVSILSPVIFNIIYIIINDYLCAYHIIPKKIGLIRLPNLFSILFILGFNPASVKDQESVKNDSLNKQKYQNPAYDTDWGNNISSCLESNFPFFCIVFKI
jgi:hypothetical protein